MLNPGVTCPNLVAGKSYCFMGVIPDDPATTTALITPTTIQSQTTTSVTTTSATTTTLPSTTTTTLPGNGVATPASTQPGMIGKCNKSHFVDTEQTCAAIAALYSISTTQFVQWNPAAKSDCTGLWALTVSAFSLPLVPPPLPRHQNRAGLFLSNMPASASSEAHRHDP
jgi:hypothetical protein